MATTTKATISEQQIATFFKTMMKDYTTKLAEEEITEKWPESSLFIYKDNSNQQSPPYNLI